MTKIKNENDNNINTMKNRWGGQRAKKLLVCGFYERDAMNIVDKLTPNSKTVVNIEKKKTF